PGGYVHVGPLATTGAHAATPAATRPPPATRRSARRVLDAPTGSGPVRAGVSAGDGDSGEAGRVSVSMRPIIRHRRRSPKVPSARRVGPIGPGAIFESADRRRPLRDRQGQE